MRVTRPFSFINSRISVSLGDDPDNIIGECQQEWHPWKRRYNLFLKREAEFEQFARIDSGVSIAVLGLPDSGSLLCSSFRMIFILLMRTAKSWLPSIEIGVVLDESCSRQFAYAIAKY